VSTPTFHLPAADTSYLDRLWLDEHGRIKLMAASEFRKVPHEHLIIWCHRRARYGLPTLELIEWLRSQIAGRFAIEVGAGNGDLGFHLGITATDSRIQMSPETRAFYATLRQPPTRPRKEVQTLDANAAVRRLKPKVVIASWLTRKFVRGVDIDGISQASIHGADEEAIRAATETYIHIGNCDSHAAKTALSLPHEVFHFPWLVSRARCQENNVIYMWKRGEFCDSQNDFPR
jgi:hypothetical protein